MVRFANIFSAVIDTATLALNLVVQILVCFVDIWWLRLSTTTVWSVVVGRSLLVDWLVGHSGAVKLCSVWTSYQVRGIDPGTIEVLWEFWEHLAWGGRS